MICFLPISGDNQPPPILGIPNIDRNKACSSKNEMMARSHWTLQLFLWTSWRERFFIKFVKERPRRQVQCYLDGFWSCKTAKKNQHRRMRLNFANVVFRSFWLRVSSNTSICYHFRYILLWYLVYCFKKKKKYLFGNIGFLPGVGGSFIFTLS